MRSATSYFKTLVRSDLRHYWPICFGYTFIWVLILPVLLLRNLSGAQDPAASAVWILRDNTVPALFMAVFFGMIAAMACFSYLMNSRSVGLLHSLPVKRSTHFLAHFTSGMAMLLGGNVIVFLLTLLAQVSAMGRVMWTPTLLWLMIVTLLDFIFFTIAIFCTMFTGWLLAVPVLYAGVNFAAAAVQALINGLCERFYFGYSSTGLSDFVIWLTPIINLNHRYSQELYHKGITSQQYMGFLRTVWIYAAVAVVLLVVNYLLYRLRHSEAAADSVAFKWAKPIFRYVIAIVGGLACGLGLHWIVMDRDGPRVGLMICLLLMTVLCYFAADMLIRKSLRVFRQGWKGMLASCAVILLLCIALQVDLFGHERYVPDAGQVKNVTVAISGNDFAEISNSTDRETIQTAIDAHKAAIAQGEPANFWDGSVRLSLTYTMTSGQMVCRSYRMVVSEDTPELHAALNRLGNLDSVEHSTILHGLSDWTAAQIRGGYISMEQEYCQMTTEQARELYNAILRDIETDDDSWDVLGSKEYYYYNIEFNIEIEGSYHESFYVDSIPQDFTETMKVINTLPFMIR